MTFSIILMPSRFRCITHIPPSPHFYQYPGSPHTRSDCLPGKIFLESMYHGDAIIIHYAIHLAQLVRRYPVYFCFRRHQKPYYAHAKATGRSAVCFTPPVADVMLIPSGHSRAAVRRQGPAHPFAAVLPRRVRVWSECGHITFPPASIRPLPAHIRHRGMQKGD